MSIIKVLHLINAMEPGGAENLLKSQLSYFSSNKFDIYVGYLSGRGQILDKTSTAYKSIDFSNNGSYSYGILFKLIKFILKNRINVIHTHLIQASLLGRLVGKILPNVKVITTRHYAKESKPNRLINKLENASLIYSDRIVCISDYVLNHLSGMGIPQKKLRLVYNGIDLKKFQPKFKNHELLIGTIGRLTEQKGMDVLLNAVRILKDKGIPVKLEIIGCGELEDELQESICDLEICDSAKLLGRLEPKDVIDNLDRWSIFALASRWEAFGIVLVEAMAMGKPVVATKVEAIPDVMSNNETGILVEPDNSNQLATALEKLLKDSNLAEKFGKNGIKRAHNMFNIVDAVGKLETIYEEMV